MFLLSWEEIAVKAPHPPPLFHLLFVLIYIRWNPAYWFTALVPLQLLLNWKHSWKLTKQKKLFWALCWQFIIEPREYLNASLLELILKVDLQSHNIQLKFNSGVNPVYILSWVSHWENEHLRRRMGFQEVSIHKQAGPLKLSVSISLPQSLLQMQSHTGRKARQTHHKHGCGLAGETLWDRYFSSTHP